MSPTPKTESLGGGGVQNVLLERGDKPVKGEGGVDVKIGEGVATVFITLQFNHIYSVCMCVWSKVPIITFWIFSLLS